MGTKTREINASKQTAHWGPTFWINGEDISGMQLDSMKRKKFSAAKDEAPNSGP